MNQWFIEWYDKSYDLDQDLPPVDLGSSTVCQSSYSERSCTVCTALSTQIYFSAYVLQNHTYASFVKERQTVALAA